MIYLPQEIVPLTPTKDQPLIFLIGPIGGGADWQATMSYIILEQKPNALIVCPCQWTAEHVLAAHFYQPYVTGPQYARRRRWEEHYIEMAALGGSEMPGCALAYLPMEHPFRNKRNPEDGPYAMDTRREMGKFAGWLKFRKDTRLVVGGNLGFHGLNTILDDLNTAGEREFTFFTDMHKLVAAALEKAG